MRGIATTESDPTQLGGCISWGEIVRAVYVSYSAYFKTASLSARRLSTGNRLHGVRLGKLVVSQLFHKFSAFYGMLRFVTVVTKPLQLFLILSHMNPNHTLPFYFFKVRYSIILTSTSGSLKGSLSFRFVHQKSVYFSFPPYMPHALPPSYHPPQFYHANTI